MRLTSTSAVLAELAPKLLKGSHLLSCYMNRKKESFSFAKVKEVEVSLLLESIDSKKSLGLLLHL